MANFRRKSNSIDGSATIFVNDEETIKIEGRGIYSTDDKREIAILRKDSEIEEINGKTKIEPNSEAE